MFFGLKRGEEPTLFVEEEFQIRVLTSLKEVKWWRTQEADVLGQGVGVDVLVGLRMKWNEDRLAFEELECLKIISNVHRVLFQANTYHNTNRPGIYLAAPWQTD